MTKAMSPPNDDVPLHAWNEAVSDIPDAGRERRRNANASELTALADALDLVSVGRVASTYTIKPLPRGRFRVTGSVSASVEQTCVVTLEPVPGEVDESFDCEFWPEADLPDAPTGEMEIKDILDIEPLDHDRVPIGRLVYETLAAGLDPNPRKDGATFDWQDPKADAPEDAKPNPFAALKDLKLGKGKV
jgi:uncharacterized metal-binding protein YceD (DUF177 family)